MTVANPQILDEEHDLASAAPAVQPILGAREESRRALADILRLLGYPREWGSPLEQQSFEQGKVWQWRSAPRTEGHVHPRSQRLVGGPDRPSAGA